MQVKIITRRDTTQNWNIANPVLNRGEFGVEILDDGSRKIKVGDGFTNWTTLPYSYINVEEFATHLNDINAHGINDIVNIINSETSQILSDITNLQGDNNSIRNRVTNTETSVNTTSSNLTTLTNTVNNNKNDIDNNIFAANARIDLLGNRVIVLENVSDSINNSFTNLNNTVNQNNNTATSAINGLISRVSTLETSDNTNRSDIITIKNDIEDIKTNTDYSTLINTVSRVDILESDVNNLQGRTSTLETNTSQNTININTINNNVSNITTRVNNLELSDTNIINQFNNLTDYVTTKVNSTEQDITNLQSDVTNIKWDIETLKNTDSNTSNDLNILENRFNNHEIQNNALFNEVHTDITNIKWDIEDLKNTGGSGTPPDLTQLTNRVNNIDDRLDEHDEKIDLINDKISELSSITSIRGSVPTFAELPDPLDFIDGVAYIVERDENKSGQTSIYIVYNGDWSFLSEFNIDLTNYYNKDEINNKFEDLDLDGFYKKPADGIPITDLHEDTKELIDGAIQSKGKTSQSIEGAIHIEGNITSSGYLDSAITMNNKSFIHNGGMFQIQNSNPFINGDVVANAYSFNGSNSRIEAASNELQLISVEGIRLQNAFNNQPLNIKNLADPINARDAANKQYVDSKVGNAAKSSRIHIGIGRGYNWQQIRLADIDQLSPGLLTFQYSLMIGRAASFSSQSPAFRRSTGIISLFAPEAGTPSLLQSNTSNGGAACWKFGVTGNGQGLLTLWLVVNTNVTGLTGARCMHELHFISDTTIIGADEADSNSDPATALGGTWTALF